MRPLLAQAPPQPAPQPPAFRAGTDLVEVEVIARDKSGIFVSDLALDDFELREDGKPYPVQQVYLRVAGPKGWDEALRGSSRRVAGRARQRAAGRRRSPDLRRRLRRCAPVAGRIQAHAGGGAHAVPVPAARRRRRRRRGQRPHGQRTPHQRSRRADQGGEGREAEREGAVRPDGRTSVAAAQRGRSHPHLRQRRQRDDGHGDAARLRRAERRVRRSGRRRSGTQHAPRQGLSVLGQRPRRGDQDAGDAAVGPHRPRTARRPQERAADVGRLHQRRNLAGGAGRRRRRRTRQHPDLHARRARAWPRHGIGRERRAHRGHQPHVRADGHGRRLHQQPRRRHRRLRRPQHQPVRQGDRADCRRCRQLLRARLPAAVAGRREVSPDRRQGETAGRERPRAPRLHRDAAAASRRDRRRPHPPRIDRSVRPSASVRL